MTNSQHPVFVVRHADYLPKQSSKLDAGHDIRACITEPLPDADFQFGKLLMHHSLIYVDGKEYKGSEGLEKLESVRENAIMIRSCSSKLVSTGFRMALPVHDDPVKNWVMLLMPRSGLSIKCSLTLTNDTGVIDAGYRDDVKVSLHNASNFAHVITDRARVAQALFVDCLSLSVVPEDKLIVSEFEAAHLESDRGGGMGSTGVK